MDENLKQITERQIRKTAKTMLNTFRIQITPASMKACEDIVRDGFKELLDTVLHGDR